MAVLRSPAVSRRCSYSAFACSARVLAALISASMASIAFSRTIVADSIGSTGVEDLLDRFGDPPS